MPSFHQLMVGLGGTALVAGGVVLWQHGPAQPPSPSGTFGFSSKTVGNSALRHGEPLSDNTDNGRPARLSVTPFHIGQSIVVASAEHVPQTVSLLTSPPDSTASPPQPKETHALSPGMVMVVSGMRILEPLHGRPQPYYEVTFSDGARGWLSEDVLRQTAK